MENNLPLVVACSGGKPEGNLAALIARRLQALGLARMVSFAGLCSNVTEASHVALASRLIVIDGCRSECAKLAMRFLGVDDCDCFDLIQAGIIEPGGVPTEAHIVKGVAHVRQLLDAG